MERKQMAVSIGRLAAFMLPVLLLLLLPMYVLWRSKEFVALDPGRVVEIQRTASSLVLFGPAFSNCSKRYKLLGARAASADALVLGSSRTMQIRAGLFLPGASFYNAGGGASRIGHLRKFLAGLSADEQPKLLLVGLDQWWFNAETEGNPEAAFSSQVQKCSNVLNLVQSSWWSIYRDIASSRLNLAAWGNTDDIGLNAQIHSNGFRNDGSYYYGRVTAHPADPDSIEDFQYRETYRRIAQGTGRFASGRTADPALVSELGKFLDDARQRGIHVLGFLPPFAPPVNDAMVRTGRYSYIPSLHSALQPVFEQRGFVLVDQTDLRALGMGKADFIDGVHAGDRAHVRMLRAMLDADGELGLYTDRTHLNRILALGQNPLVVVTDRLR